MTTPQASTSAAASASTAQKTWELANNVQLLEQDKIFRHDEAEQKAILNARPWRNDPHHFKRVRISGVAMIKMVMHARSGGQYEIMGLMQGKIDGDTFVVMDSFALPVQGTETRVNAANEANEYMVEFIERSKNVGRLENIVGWYHSHPGYGCWLSGIDVNTQLTNQSFQDPFVAVVIDPNRTISAGRIDIGAFRTYPADYTPPNAASSEYQSIPLAKIEDFGAHANSYYALEIEHFKSSLDSQILDLLWNKYWVMTLSQSPLISNRAYATSQISDLVDKLSRTEQSVSGRCHLSSLAPLAVIAQLRANRGGAAAASRRANGEDASGSTAPTKEEEKQVTQLAKALRDAEKIDGEAKYGMISQILKDAVFNKWDQAQLVLPTS